MELFESLVNVNGPKNVTVDSPFTKISDTLERQKMLLKGPNGFPTYYCINISPENLTTVTHLKLKKMNLINKSF